MTGRLGVELRILATVGLLGFTHIGQCFGVANLVLDPPTRARLMLDPSFNLVLLAVPGLAILAAMIHVAVRMPGVRWDREPGPSPLPLMVLGFPVVVVWPWLFWRDRRARDRKLEGEEVEIAFRTLLDIPSVAGAGFCLWMAVATTIVGVVVGTVLELPPRSNAQLLGLWLCLLLPLVAIVISRTRAMLVPEFVTAPRPVDNAMPHQRSVRLRLGAPALLVIAAAAFGPILVGYAWADRVDESNALKRARAEVTELAGLARRGSPIALGEFLADHPEAMVELVIESNAGREGTVRRYGKPVLLPSNAVGIVELGGERVWAHREQTGRGPLLAVTPITVPDPSPMWLVLVVGLLGLATGLVAVVTVVRDVDRDLGRATTQVATVADGGVPESLSLSTFTTRELRELVASVDRLVGRIADANVAKYVLIERSREVDRLRSQFLANMSHDLRSPLNSVLGFSELLQTGIEGEIAEDQREMIQAIHHAGKELLQQIDDILDTAKIEAGRLDLHREPTPPATLISRAIQAARARLGPIEFDTSTSPGLPSAFVDPYRAVQAIENVLVFVGELLERGTLDVRCLAERDEAGNFEIVIRVKGPRVARSLEQLAHAGRGFARMPGHAGLGLSLPIATSLLELQGGSLRVHQQLSDREPVRRDGEDDALVAMTFELRLPAVSARKGARLRMSDALARPSEDHDRES